MTKIAKSFSKIPQDSKNASFLDSELFKNENQITLVALFLVH